MVHRSVMLGAESARGLGRSGTERCLVCVGRVGGSSSPCQSMRYVLDVSGLGASL